MSSVFIDAKVSDEERRTRLYEGDIFVFAPTAATKALIDLARSMLEQAFHPHDPRTVHKEISAEGVAAILAKSKPQCIHHPQCKEIIPQIMREQGAAR